jgi:solute carrier family 35 protein C2
MTSSDDLELEDLLSEDGLEDDEETGLTSGDRRKRRKRKRRNTLLDQRIMPDGGMHQREEEERLAKKTFWYKIVVNTTLIGLWYLFSISITLVRPFLFSSHSVSRRSLSLSLSLCG